MQRQFPLLPLPVARLGLAMILVGILILALIPNAEVPVSTSWDKLDHVLAFFTLALLGEYAFPQWSFWRAVTLGLILYGVGIEIAQSFTPDRQSSLLDVLADGVGILLYGAVRQLRSVWACRRCCINGNRPHI